ncbi:hypothetical protein [Streptomyces sp. NPDC059828]|uniref:hypothetical protein n=1 Tax=Streptomyces sp. NPDC059828 TaxID=3346965 RepID=UPI003654AEA7
MRTSPGRAGLAAMAASTVVGAVALIVAQPAYAQYPPVPPLVLDPTVVCPGDSVTFHATGFRPGQRTTLQLQTKSVVLGHFNADPQGDVDGTVPIPPGTHNGKYTVRLEAVRPERELSAKLTVKKPGDCTGSTSSTSLAESGNAGSLSAPELAATGRQDDSLKLFGGAAGLALLGGGTVMAVRRFKSS